MRSTKWKSLTKLDLFFSAGSSTIYSVGIILESLRLFIPKNISWEGVAERPPCFKRIVDYVKTQPFFFPFLFPFSFSFSLEKGRPASAVKPIQLICIHQDENQEILWDCYI